MTRFLTIKNQTPSRLLQNDGFWGVTRMAIISRISLKQSVGGSGSYVPGAQFTDLFCERSDGPTDVLLFLPDQEYIYTYLDYF